jgi:hypothetical protein
MICDTFLPAKGASEAFAPLAGNVVIEFKPVKTLLMGKNKSNQYN